MKHKYLTKFQRQNVLKYLELVESNDVESIKLGITLCYEEYKDKLIKFSFESPTYHVLLYPEISFKFLNKTDIKYWIDMIKALFNLGYYEQT